MSRVEVAYEDDDVIIIDLYDDTGRLKMEQAFATNISINEVFGGVPLCSVTIADDQ